MTDNSRTDAGSYDDPDVVAIHRLLDSLRPPAFTSTALDVIPIGFPFQ